ncbi:hypothetical protein Q5H93_03380 [Hymenobacter sp. ASUV-10]|uniref:Uncharacterized protein n=1 Tax=Hymenobacter aranciens TaxID=3063996 RepID=A0ABT9B7I7_9BACT|nr:hypothetical protein [Hymenobacter sp. ASUV-10]MDO7873760.1 hypothetical protein [Hymenobacter sp. ASUV-10]
MYQEFATIADLLLQLQKPAIPHSESYYRVGEVTQKMTADILAVTGLQVAGFTVMLDLSGVRHTLKKHGLHAAASQLAQGQLPIVQADFQDLVDWVLQPDSIIVGKPRLGKHPMPCCELQSSQPTGLVSAVLEYRPGRRRLVLVTMYKKRPTT